MPCIHSIPQPRTRPFQCFYAGVRQRNGLRSVEAGKLYAMIIYKPGDWWKALWHFHTTRVLWVLLGRVTLVGVYVAAVTVAQVQYFRFVFEVEREFFSFLGILLSLLLVFRTNTAYDRYYEGRRQWGQLIGACRNLAAILGGQVAHRGGRAPAILRPDAL